MNTNPVPLYINNTVNMLSATILKLSYTVKSRINAPGGVTFSERGAFIESTKTLKTRSQKPKNATSKNFQLHVLYTAVHRFKASHVYRLIQSLPGVDSI